MTFYTFATGRVPYEDKKDTLDIIHAHLSEELPSIEKYNHDFPKVIDGVIKKLVSKDPRNRYQTAYSLGFDLKTIYQKLIKNEGVSDFPLGDKDIQGRFEIPSKIYGRDNEIKSLIESFQKTSQGSFQTVEILGPSGIGKSSTVHQMHPQIVLSHGLYIAGKFEQYKKDIPYSALKKALHSLVGQLAILSEDHIRKLRFNLQKNLKDRSELIIDFVPGFSKIFGKKDIHYTSRGHAENAEIFNDAIISLFKTVATKDHPLTLFIDDWQWSDGATIQLMGELLKDDGLNHLCLIFAYRDNEVDSKHIFRPILNRLNSRYELHNKILLKPLEHSFIEEFVFEIFGKNLKMEELSQIVTSKTGGNPFFAREFIKKLYYSELINFDARIGNWICLFPEIKKLSTFENVVELLISELKTLPREVQKTLQLAASLGAEFSLKSLCLILDSKIEEIIHHCWVLQQKEIVIAVGGLAKILQCDKSTIKELDTSDLNTINVHFKFPHDRVQQASYQLVNPELRKKIHEKIAASLKTKLKGEDLEKAIFDIVNHMNQSVTDEFTEEKINDAILLNYQAASKSLKTSGFQSALIYVSKARDLMKNNDSLLVDKDFHYKIEFLFAECLHLNQKYREADEIIHGIFDQELTKGQRFDLYHLLLRMSAAQSDYSKATDFALKGLAEFDIKISKNISYLGCLVLALRALIKFRNFDFSSLLEAPETEDKEVRKLFNFISSSATSIYLYDIKLLVSVFCLFLIKTLRKTTHKGQAFIISSHGVVVQSIFFNHKRAMKIMEISEKMLKRFPDPKSIAQTHLILTYNSGHAYCDIERRQELSEAGYQAGLIAGDFAYAAFDFSCGTYISSLIGRSAQSAKEMGEESYIFARDCKQEDMSMASMAGLVYSKWHLKETKNLESLNFESKGMSYKEDEVWKIKNPGMLALGLTPYILIKTHIGNYKETLRFIGKVPLYQILLMGSYAIHMYKWAKMTSYLGLWNTFSFPKKFFYNLLNWGNVYFFKTYYNYKPNFYGPLYFMAKGHMGQMKLLFSPFQKDLRKAAYFYIRGARIAEKNGQYFNTGLCYESLGDAYLQMFDIGKCRQYYKKALDAYERYGSYAKQETLMNKHHGLMRDYLTKLGREKEIINNGVTSNKTIMTTSPLTTKTTSGSVVDTTDQSKNIDLETFIICNRTLSEKIQFGPLMNTMEELIIKNAGATECYFFQNQGEEATLNSLVSLKGDLKKGKSLYASHIKNISHNAINYVLRTSSDYILNSETLDIILTDNYYKKEKPLSLAVLPIAKKGRIEGVLYIENRLVSEAFTDDRLKLVKSILNQMMISLENVQLYEDLEDKIKERTRDLKKTHKKMLDLAHQAGKTDTASGLLHHIGNLLPMVSLGVDLSLDKIRGLKRKINLFNKLKWKKKQQNEVSLIEKLTHDLEGDRLKLMEEIDKTKNNLEMITRIMRSYTANMSKEVFRVEVIPRQFLSDMLAEYKNKGFDIQLDFGKSEELDSIFELEKHKIHYAIASILNNAVESGEEVLVETQIVSGRWFIQISDNGKGIREGDAQKIFSAGFTTKENHLGLGLHDSFNYILSLDGTIKLKNAHKKFKGASFIIEIPLINEAGLMKKGA